MSGERFKITDQREEAIRQRAAESVIWNEDEARVPTRLSDALWAAVRDRETLLELLRSERNARLAAEGERDRLREAIDAVLADLSKRTAFDIHEQGPKSSEAVGINIAIGKVRAALTGAKE